MNLTRFFYLLMIMPFFTYSQFQISGKITDTDGEEIEFANVVITNPDNGVIVKGVITDQYGYFNMEELDEGTYSITISFIGFRDWKKSIQLKENIDLGTIILKEAATGLDEVVVEGKKPLIKRKVDRLIYNVENSSIASTGSVWDALTKAPGVSSDSRDNIRAFNKSAAVMIDGRIMKLSPESIADMLKGMSAEDIANIEIITAPPAKYEASGGVLININTKKMLKNGYRGNTRYYHEQAKLGRDLAGGNIYYKSNKIDISANYSFLHGSFQKLDDENIRYIEKGTVWHLDRNGRNRKRSHVYNISMDYYISEKDRLGIKFDGFDIDNH